MYTDGLAAYYIGRSLYADRLAEAERERLFAAVRPRRPLGPRMQALISTLARGVAILGLGSLAQGR